MASLHLPGLLRCLAANDRAGWNVSRSCGAPASLEMAEATAQDDLLRAVRMAERQIADFGVLNAPVPVTAMTRRAGLVLRYADFPRDPRVSGFIDADTKTIYVNAADPPERQMFTLAHELGHWLLHNNEVHGGRTYRALLRGALGSAKTAMEQEADAFAVNLLIPAFLLDKYCRHSVRRPGCASLSRLFGVPKDVIRFRLENV